MSRSWAGGSTRAWRKTRARVLARDGYRCHVPGVDGRLCGAHATHVDHIVPKAAGGTDDDGNLRAACAPCNLSRTATTAAAGPTVTVHVIIGPPGAGKTTWAREWAADDDLVIDLDVLAAALHRNPWDVDHTYPKHVRNVAIGARSAAIRRAVALAAGTCDVWIVHALPTLEQLRRYVADGWDVRVVDPGPGIVRARLHLDGRSRQHEVAVDQWYARVEQVLDILTPADEWTW